MTNKQNLNSATCNDWEPFGVPIWPGLRGLAHIVAQLKTEDYLNNRFKGAGIAQWLERRTRDWKVAGSNPCWNGGRIFFSRVDFLCWLLFRYPFHPRVTTVARKKSRSFCQKCRWQVTAKHAYTLRIEPCFGIGHNLSLICQMTSEDIKHQLNNNNRFHSSGAVRPSRGGRPGLSVLTSLLVSVDVKIYWTVLRHWSQLGPNMSTDIWGH